MISLASSLKCSAQQPAAQASKGGTADASGAAHVFPGVLAAAAPGQGGEADAETASAAGLTGKAAPGTALPISLRSGKTLPVLADTLADSTDEAGAAVSQDDIAQLDPAQAEDEAPSTPGNAAQPIAVFAQLPLPDGAAPVPQTSGGNAKKSSETTPRKGSTPGQSPLSAKVAPEPQPPAPSVTVHVAAQADASIGDRPLRVGESAAGPGKTARATREEGPAKTDASFGAAPVKMDSPLPASAMVSSNTLVDAARDRAHDSAKAASPIAAMQDLTSVVDRLVAAREAFAPATAAMTLRHGELGDLSLRFDQLRDGHLAVQLSASNPDAHRAMVAAVSDAGFRGTADGQTATSQQSAQPQANARGGSAGQESGSAGNGGAARNDQQQQRRTATPQQQRPGGDQRRAGIFA